MSSEHIRSLYRHLLRTLKTAYPSYGRTGPRDFVRSEIRTRFRKNRDERDPHRLHEMILDAEKQLKMQLQSSYKVFKSQSVQSNSQPNMVTPESAAVPEHPQAPMFLGQNHQISMDGSNHYAMESSPIRSNFYANPPIRTQQSKPMRTTHQESPAKSQDVSETLQPPKVVTRPARYNKAEPSAPSKPSPFVVPAESTITNFRMRPLNPSHRVISDPPKIEGHRYLTPAEIAKRVIAEQNEEHLIRATPLKANPDFARNEQGSDNILPRLFVSALKDSISKKTKP